MRNFLIVPILLMSLTATAHAACQGPTGKRPNKAGVLREVCLDDKYSTCMENNLTGGWTQAEATRRCDQLKAQGKVR